MHNLRYTISHTTCTSRIGFLRFLFLVLFPNGILSGLALGVAGFYCPDRSRQGYFSTDFLNTFFIDYDILFLPFETSSRICILLLLRSAEAVFLASFQGCSARSAFNFLKYQSCTTYLAPFGCLVKNYTQNNIYQHLCSKRKFLSSCKNQVCNYIVFGKHWGYPRASLVS